MRQICTDIWVQRDLAGGRLSQRQSRYSNAACYERQECPSDEYSTPPKDLIDLSERRSSLKGGARRPARREQNGVGLR